ncbi:MAG: DUF255 domain-containing protein [Planctomycetaceae bacterium]
MDRRTALVRIAAAMVGGRLLSRSADAAESAAESEISWLGDLEAAHRLALEMNRPLLITFGAKWCTFCKKMDANTFADPAVVRAVNGSYVPVRLDFDAEPRVARVLEVRSIPCTIVLSPQADLLARVDGYVDPQRYAAALAAADRLQSRVQHARFERIRRAP